MVRYLHVNESLIVTSAVTSYKFEFTKGKDSILLKNVLTDSIVLKIKSPDKLLSIELDKPVGNCSFKKTQFVHCDASKKDDPTQKDEEKLSESGNLFIPSFEQEVEYLKRAAIFETTESEVCCPGTQELIFDYSAQCLVPTCRICKKCKKNPKNASKAFNFQFKCHDHLNSLGRFHPRVDNGVRVRITGMNPYRDNLILHVDFEDRNKEGRAMFQAIMDRLAKAVDSTQSKSQNTSIDSNNTIAQEADLTPSKKAEKFIPAFQSEMTRFYQEKFNADHLTAGFLAQCVTHIQGNIKKHFEIPTATSELMIQKLEEWLKDSILDKEFYRSMLKDGIEHYNKILNYRTATAWLFQVKDNDITKLGFEWYRDGKRVSANPQTFEFFNRGGFTIDYSVGIIINRLVNHAFTTIGFDTIIDNNNVTKYRVVRQRGSDINIGPALLAHAYYRYPVWNRFKIGATTGFMTNTRDNDFGFNFLFGGSFLFGSKERFNLTSGVVLGKVARLREGLDEGVTVLDAPLNGQTSDVQTRDIYRQKWFIGVTYNLGR
jgi:hypothetical protein